MASWGVKKPCLLLKSFCLIDSYLYCAEYFVIMLHCLDDNRLHCTFYSSEYPHKWMRFLWVECWHSSVFLWPSNVLTLGGCGYLCSVHPMGLQHHKMYKLSFFHQVVLSKHLDADHYWITRYQQKYMAATSQIILIASFQQCTEMQHYTR